MQQNCISYMFDVSIILESEVYIYRSYVINHFGVEITVARIHGNLIYGRIQFILLRPFETFLGESTTVPAGAITTFALAHLGFLVSSP